MLSSGNLGVGIGLDVLWRLNAAAVNYATTWSFATYAQANNGALPGPWANVRRTGTATYESSSGVITTLPDLGGGTYAARVQYRSGTARGLLIEGQATQYLGKSEDFSHVLWTIDGNGTATPVVTANYGTAPDGTASADRIQLNRSGGSFARIRSIAWPAATATYTVSVWMKNLAAGTANVGLRSGSTGINCAVTEAWQRFSLTITGASPDLQILLFSSIAGNDVSADVLAWGAQLEAGAYATSYVPSTGGSEVVRAADSAGVFLTSSALSAAFPGGVGQPWTTVFQYRKGYSVSSDETLFALSAGSSAGSTNLLALQTNGTQAQAVHSGGSGTLSGTLVHDGSTVNKIALSVDPTYRGAELLTNGDFASGTGWSTGGGVSISGGKLNFASVGVGTGAAQTIAATVGKVYRVTLTVSDWSSGSGVWVQIGTGAAYQFTAAANGTYSLDVTATGTLLQLVSNNASSTFKVDDLSVKEMGAVSVSVNGAAAVETTGIAFTGSGTTHLIPGARTTGGSTPVLGMEIYDWRNVNTSYTTGASLQALSA